MALGLRAKLNLLAKTVASFFNPATTLTLEDDVTPIHLEDGVTILELE